ncbi:glycosyltransferase family 2 protein [Faecalibacterium prausnitzii]|uniref:Glycosyltransferase family 2 protein n=1 Tax=Faecalibacterium prausnitzii TaxID=853 RepID=A0A329UCZ6_9FIRM|nr:glycosyltransferase family 2 protein [Faecalibacterium prausnitzii]RAW60041.1 glycosyltransferase family 2 protein [Faecalibacterium prausnitzii]
MQLDKETKLKQEKERCRQLAQRVAEEARPASAQVLNSESDLLEKALRRAGIRAEEWSAQAAEPVDLLVVEDPVWSHLPQQLPEKVLLASVDSTMMAAWAEQLARRGYYRDFRWRSRGRAQQSALFCTGSAVPAPLMMVQGYEQEMDTLRDRMVRAERTCSEEAALIERLRSDLVLSRSHEQQLEKTLSDVTNSTFWKLTWPMRYAVSKSRQIWHTFPLFVFLHDLRAMGVEGVREQARARREYAVLFPSKTLRADRFAPVELLVKQASHQPGGEAGPKISIVVPLYNTPLNFLEELLDSVVNQTYRNWELCCVDAGQDTAVGQHVQARAKADPRIRYQKLTENEGIAGNTNHGFELATGDYIALLDHDDILHPCALWYTAQAIVEQGADFVYTDEATFEGKVENVVLYHFKPDFMLDNLRSNNYICHLTTFSKVLMEQAGGGERAEYNGSQDYDLFLRLTEKARKIAHIPHALYYWRSSPNSTASDISAKTYCIDAGIAALKAHYARCGVAVDDVTLIPGTPGYYKTDYTMAHPGRVSILIPTCDHIRDLETCVESIYARTTYPDFEILLIENNSKEEQTFRSYERMQKEHPDTLKVLTWQGKGFNYSALNNFGAQYATGEYLLLLNNDTEVITPGWLEEMVMYAQQKRVGCVGAKLLYPDDTIQHAGVGFGIGGVAGHLHKYFPATSDGYMGRLNYVQDVYGDTAACLLIRKEIYDEVHGLDESYAVAFNDVDFCVRVREAGYTNVFTPFAQLYHYESKSRGMEDNPEKQKRFQGEVLRFQARWGDLLAKGDPCTNPNFDIQREDFSLKILPLE